MATAFQASAFQASPAFQIDVAAPTVVYGDTLVVSLGIQGLHFQHTNRGR